MPSVIATRGPGSGSARYVAEPHEIKQRYAEWEIIGAPEVREISSNARYFTPRPRETPLGNLGPILTIVRGKPGQRLAIAGEAS